MEEKTTARTTSGTATPATNPMNLTCKTAPASTAVSDSAPSEVMILINPKGNIVPPDPNDGWVAFVEADSGVEYELVNQGAADPKPHWLINGIGVAIYYKE